MGSPSLEAQDEAPSGRVALVAPVLVVAGSVLVGVLSGVPGLRWLASLSTAAHEAGHALVADLLVGDVIGISVRPDRGGGLAVYRGAGDSAWWRLFLTAAAGYIGAFALGAALTAVVAVARSTRWVAAGLAAATLLAWVLWVPTSPPHADISGAHQRYTWLLLLGLGVLLAVLVAVPELWRRLALAVVAAATLGGAWDARHRLVVDGQQTDLDAMAELAPILSAGAWSWVVRAVMVLIGLACIWLALRTWTRRLPPPPSPGV